MKMNLLDQLLLALIVFSTIAWFKEHRDKKREKEAWGESCVEHCAPYSPDLKDEAAFKKNACVCSSNKMEPIGCEQ